MRNFHIVLLLVTVIASSRSDSDTGPPGPFKFFEIKDCDPVLNKISIKPNLQTDNDNVDSLSFSYRLSEDLTDDTFVSVTADKFDGTDWETNAVEIEQQPLFKVLNEFIPNIWKNFREQVSPPIADIKKIPAGEYNIDNFQAIYKDINSPQVVYGRLRANVFLSKDDVDFACLSLDFQANQPPEE